MTEHNFRYRVIKGVPLPVIPLEVKFQKGLKIVDVYVDSGASVSIFKSAEAIRLGIDLETGDLIYITVGDGGEIPVWLHKLKICIEDECFEATVGFSERLGIGFNILGQRDIFERFHICFDNKYKYLTFAKPVSAKTRN